MTKKRSIYCGNNRLDDDLVSGKKTIGNRYQCMKVGINKGLKMEMDIKYKNEYDPIDKTRIYCGLKKKLPKEYDRYGNSVECLRKGIGIGKSIKARKSRRRSKTRRSRKRSKTRRSRK